MNIILPLSNSKQHLSSNLNRNCTMPALSTNSWSSLSAHPARRGLCGGPDAPLTIDCHPYEESSGGVGIKELNSVSQPCIIPYKNELSKEHPVKITFRYPLTRQTVLAWDTILLKNKLYIEVPNGCLPDASKEAFVALLEYAEEVLRCENAIVCFASDRSDRAILIRTFMFLGFFVVPPGHDLSLDKSHVCMVYNMN